jgi:glycosyltransferase involved in cell wall biosynthesis
MLTQSLSVVIPVYRASDGLRIVVDELLSGSFPVEVDDGVEIGLEEVILVCDNPGLSAADRAGVRSLEDVDPRVRTVWLARNFGQHPATIAGIVSTNGDWVVTMDEDGHHDPQQIHAMILVAAGQGVPLVYARPTNPPPHGVLRNAASRSTKVLFRTLSGAKGEFHSFRLIEGSIARSACAYIGDSVYLDVAMTWSCGDAAFCPMAMRAESSTVSSYNYRKLLSHFWRMVLSTGARPLRLVAVAGVLVALMGLVVAGVVAQRRLTGDFSTAPGWASLIVSEFILAGGVLITLAVLAEYVSFAVRNSIGKPLYVRTEHVDSRVLWSLQEALQATPAKTR